jgi:hypothetical protein
VSLTNTAMDSSIESAPPTTSTERGQAPCVWPGTVRIWNKERRAADGSLRLYSRDLVKRSCGGSGDYEGCRESLPHGRGRIALGS